MDQTATPSGRMIIVHTLEENPTRNYPAWKIQICDYAATLATEYFDGGVLSLGILWTDEEWNTRNPPVVPENGGEAVPVPRPDLPTRPEMHAGNATPATINIWKEANLAFKAYTAASGLLKDAILSSMGSTCFDAVYDPINGHSTRTVQWLMAYVAGRFSTPTDADLKFYKSSLEVPFSHDTKFSSEAAKMAFVFRILASVGQPKCMSDQLDYLEAATAHLPVTAPLVAKYKESQPNVANRTFSALVAFIELHAPNVTTSTSNHANSAKGQNASLAEEVRAMWDNFFLAGLPWNCTF